MAVMFQNEGISCSNEAFQQPLFMPTSSSSFHGSRSMVNFQDICGGNAPGRQFYQPHDQEEMCDDDLDECFRQPGKKRRLTTDQVQFLERNFEVENKLEPERKVKLAKDLGLQPRQIAIWFQNRRARWKTKQLEKDYDVLRASYNSLKADYETLLKETDKLKAEVLTLTDKQSLKEKDGGNSELSDSAEPSQPEAQLNSAPTKKPSDVPKIVCKQEDLSSTNSAVFDTDSPHYTDGVHSSLSEPAHSSHVFEHDQSDLSQDEEDELSKKLVPPIYNFPKLEDTFYSDTPADSCNYGFPVEDQAPWFWAY